MIIAAISSLHKKLMENWHFLLWQNISNAVIKLGVYPCYFCGSLPAQSSKTTTNGLIFSAAWPLPLEIHPKPNQFK